VRLWSVVSVWELAVKWRLGKLQLPAHPSEWNQQLERELALESLPVRRDHAVRVADLPDHHRDPFDRLLVAQAQIEDVPIITADGILAKYNIEIIAAL
jgi:PIN domain nuclease of toxin-antitoxin system